MFKIYTLMIVFALFITFFSTAGVITITDKINGYHTRSLGILNTDVNK